MKKSLIASLAFSLALALPSPAAQLVLWSFPTPLSGIGSGTAIPPTVENVVGAPTLTMLNQTIDANGKDGADYTDSTGVNRPATTNGAIAWDDFRGPGADGEVRMTLNTTGFVDLSLRFDIKLNDDPLDSSTRVLLVDYSTDGGTTFVPATTLNITNDAVFSARTVNLAAIAAVENVASVILRLSQGGSSDANALNDSVSFDNLEITGTGGGGANSPTLTIAAATTARLSLPATGGGIASGVIGDPTDPAAQQGVVFTLADPDTPVGSLTFTATSSNPTVVPAANLVATGSGASRTLKITPAAVGTATITATVTDPQSNAGTYTITYAASAASSTPAATRYHTGASDASAAVPIGTTHMLVANDEDQVLRLYERANSGLPVATFNLNTSLALAKEADLETAVRIGNRVYWIASHGNGRDGDAEPTRRIAFSTDLTGSGAGTGVIYVNQFTGLRDNLIAWDNANGHGLGAGALGLAASAAAGVLPTVANGFNIEAATVAPGSSTILLGFRAPLQNTAQRHRALVIPATNLTSVIDAGAGTVTFGAPAFLDLGGRAIRSMDTAASGQVLILAGPVDNRVAGQEANTFRFFLWDGNAASAPLPLTSTIDDIAANAVGGSPESVFDLPAAITNGSTVGILVDNGSSDHYGTGQASKDLAANWQKFRADPVTLSGLPNVVTTNADSGAGSLRQAVADAAPGATILFAPALSGQTIPLTSGQLLLSKSVTIDASALVPGVTISGEDASRIFEVFGQTVTLRGLTLREGFATAGGAIFNNGGVLTVSGCTLLGNIAEQGGAIYSDTNLVGEKTTLLHTTLTGNVATVRGGAIYNFDGLTEVRHCTIVENGAPAGEGGGIASYGDAFTQTAVTRSIVAGNASADVDLVVSATNSFASSGYNLVGSGDAIAAFNQPGDVTAAVPQLAPLGDYGGPTPTMMPRRGSLAIDAVLAATPAGTDQRGAVAPVDGNGDALVFADIGAVEVQTAVVTNAQDSGAGSLRDAIAQPFASTVTFSPAVFNGEPADTILLASELTLNRLLAIDAGGVPAGVIVSGNNATRVFSIGAGAEVTIEKLAIVGGNSGSNGGAGVVVTDNAQVAFADCLIAENVTTGFGGGGILILDGAVTLSNCTLASNSANDGGAIWAQGGASSLHLRHTTVAGNSGIHAIVSFVGLTLENSVVAGNSGNNFFESQPGKPLLVGQNFTTGDPRLLPLGHYGGLTRSRPPPPDSPLVNAAPASTVTLDQRGAPRPTGSTPDIGAVEYVPALVTSSASAGNDSLREVRDRPFVSTILFDPAVFNGEPGDVILLGTELNLEKSVLIDASTLARGVTISGGNDVSIFTVRAGEAVGLRGLSLTNGSSGEGGAILNRGALALTRCTLAGNSALFRGGAISSLTGSSTTLTQCTLANNSVTSGGVNFGGGAIFNLGTLALTHCTVSANTTATQTQGGGIINAGPATLMNNLSAGNMVGPASVGADIINEGHVTRAGANLIQDQVDANGGSSTGPGPINAPPLLAPLADYGGPTETMAQLPGSPARNNSVGSTFPTDQRGFFTIGTPDLGAYEAGSALVTYAAWAYETLPPGADYSFTADFEKDGRANGLEYATHTDPLAATGGAIPARTLDALRTSAFVQFPFRFAATDLIYEVERSTDLVTWTKIVEIDRGQIIYEAPGVLYFDQDAFSLTYSDAFPAGQSKVFYHLRVRLP